MALLRPRDAVGHEQRGSRYAVIASGNQLLAGSTVLICPTSTSAGPAIFRPEVEVRGVRTRVLVDQITAVDWHRLGDFVGALNPDEMADVDRGLAYALGQA